MIYVCGASGYIGSNLLAMYPECVGLERGYIPETVKGDCVINLAAYGHHPGQEDVDTMVKVNTLWPIKLWERLHPNARMVQGCSSSERDDPNTQYSRSKSLATKFLTGKAILAWIYTPFGGINEPPHRFMSALLKTAREGGTFHVEHPGAMRDLIHVSHVCKGLYRLATEEIIPSEAHLGSGQNQFHDSVAIRAAKISGKMTVTRGLPGRGKQLFPAPNPYVNCDFVEDLRREITG